MFDLWMEEVDRILEKVAGLDTRDLPDAPYRDMFDDGLTPKEGANVTLCEAGYSDLASGEDDY